MRIAARTSRKSSMVALRLPLSVISRLWKSGSEKRISVRTTPTRTSVPPCATQPKLCSMAAVLPVASKTRSKKSSPVRSRQAIARGLVGGEAVAQAQHIAAEGEPVGARVEKGHLRPRAPGRTAPWRCRSARRPRPGCARRPRSRRGARHAHRWPGTRSAPPGRAAARRSGTPGPPAWRGSRTCRRRNGRPGTAGWCSSWSCPGGRRRSGRRSGRA